jgi:hypothetical protein
MMFVVSVKSASITAIVLRCSSLSERAKFPLFTLAAGSWMMHGRNWNTQSRRAFMRNKLATVSALAIFTLFGCAVLSAQQTPPPSTATSSAQKQTETDEYTRYELLAPETASFKIYYEVTATTPGAKFFYNPIRKGSAASDEAVFDSMTGDALHFEVVSGAEARKDPLMAEADADTNFIKISLARPVPSEGQGRVLILKTYKDAKSYFREGDAIVFNRPLGIKRNKIVLPAGFELVGCNVPSQVLTEADGRIAISFLNPGSGEAPLILRAKLGAQTGPSAAPHPSTQARSWESAFSLYHDYTESHEGADKYLNIVREGSTVSDPSAYILDTGEKLPTKLMTGADLTATKIEVGEPVTPTTQVVLIPFPPVKKGQSIRLRISETYTAPTSYRLDGDELIFDRSLGRPRNAVVLPTGWYLIASTIPSTVTQLPDGRIRLDFWNGRPDSVDVLIKARRRTK